MEVGVRELKRRLSEYLDRAAGGEVIRVTDRGRPKAILGPVPTTRVSGLELPPLSAEQREAIRRGIERGIREGWIKEGNGEPPALNHRRFRSSVTIQQMMDEDRGE